MFKLLRGALTCAFTVAAFAITGCGTDSGAFQAAYEKAYSDGADRAASVPVNVDVDSAGGVTVDVANSGALLASGTLVYASGDTVSTELSGASGELSAGTGARLSYIQVETAAGDYWYFDRYGDWLPNGYTPAVSAVVVDEHTYSPNGKGASGLLSSLTSILSSTLKFVVSDACLEVKVYYKDGSVKYPSYSLLGYYVIKDPSKVVVIQVTLASDGSKWYYDSAGNLLPLDSRWYQDMD